jgi:molybdenum cofactor cytidylyltransferase
MNRVRVAILAAGESRRMGQPKLCLPWGTTSILGHILNQWCLAGVEDLLVVHPPDAESSVIRELDRLAVPPGQRIPNAAMERGMMGSIVSAARVANPSASHLIIALGDQPHLELETLRALLEACARRKESIIRVVFEGKPAHPLALPARLLPELAATSCATLRGFIGLHDQAVFDLTIRDSGVLLDLDTPDDYVRASKSAERP